MPGDPWTDIEAGGARDFPPTRWTIVRDASDRDSASFRASLDELASTYWRPVYAYFRRKWSRPNEEAKDLTQDFFASLAERELLHRAAPERGRFRSYVMAALDNFARMDRRREGAAKRGGDVARIPLDTPGIEPAASEDPAEASAASGRSPSSRARSTTCTPRARSAGARTCGAPSTRRRLRLRPAPTSASRRWPPDTGCRRPRCATGSSVCVRSFANS